MPEFIAIAAARSLCSFSPLFCGEKVGMRGSHNGSRPQLGPPPDRFAKGEAVDLSPQRAGRGKDHSNIEERGTLDPAFLESFL